MTVCTRPSSAIWAGNGQAAPWVRNCGRNATNSSRALGFRPLTPAPFAAQRNQDRSARSVATVGAGGRVTVVTPSQSKYTAPNAVSTVSTRGERAITAATPAATTAVSPA